MARVEGCTFQWNEERELSVLGHSTIRDSICDSRAHVVGVTVTDECHLENVMVFGAGSSFSARLGSRFVNCTASEFFEGGFTTEDGCSLTRCIARTTQSEAVFGFRLGSHCDSSHGIVQGAVSSGISTGSFCNLQDSIVRGATGPGVAAGQGSRVVNCTATDCNSGEAIDGGGIVADADVVIQGAITANNHVAGILYHGVRGRVERSSTFTNLGAGMIVLEGASARDNYVVANQAVGIHASGDRFVIRGNQVDLNGNGVLVNGHTSLVIENRAAKNLGNDFDVNWGNAVGPLLNAEATVLGSKPQANFGKP